MKKFFLLLNKEIKELLTPQLIVPFVAVMAVFFLIGNVAGKQVEKQASAREVIAVYDGDGSSLSSSAVTAISQMADVQPIEEAEPEAFVGQMKERKISVGLVIPPGFEQSVQEGGSAAIRSYSLLNNFSALSSKKYSVLASSHQVINEMVSNYLIKSALASADVATLKNPITNQNFVASRGRISEGNPIEVLAYISQQTTYVPIVLFVVIIMAAQMIASAVATEKENKTLETLLSLPISRRTIATTKMIAAGVVSLLMAAIYMFGIRSFSSGISSGFQPAASGGPSASSVAESLGLAFTTLGYLELGGILFLGILFALAVAMILGAFSEDAKSAQGVIAPLMVLVLIPYFITLLLDIETLSAPVRYIIYAIPFSHIFLASPNILLGNHLFVLYGAIYLLVLFIISVIITGKIFSSDLILTMKLNLSKKK